MNIAILTYRNPGNTKNNPKIEFRRIARKFPGFLFIRLKDFRKGICYKYDIDNKRFYKSKFDVNDIKYIYNRSFNKDNRLLYNLGSIGITILNNPELCKLCANKVSTHRFLLKHRIPTVRYININNVHNKNIFKMNRHGWYLKPIHGCQGKGIKLITERNKHLLDSISFSYFLSSCVYRPGTHFDIRSLIQVVNGQFKTVYNIVRTGNEITNLSNGGNFMVLEQFINNDNDIRLISRHNRQADGLPVSIIDDIEKINLQIANTINNEFGGFIEIGVDYLVNRDDKPVVLELNSQPGHIAKSRLDDIPYDLQDKYAKAFRNAWFNPIKQLMYMENNDGNI